MARRPCHPMQPVASASAMSASEEPRALLNGRLGRNPNLELTRYRSRTPVERGRADQTVTRAPSEKYPCIRAVFAASFAALRSACPTPAAKLGAGRFFFAFKALSPVVAVLGPNYRKWPRHRPMAGTRAENCPSFARSAVLRPISGHRDHLAAPGLQRVAALIANFAA